MALKVRTGGSESPGIITMNTLHDICVILDCPIEAVVKIEKGDK